MDINKFTTFPLNKSLPAIPEGSVVLNERGEIIGIMQQKQVVLLPGFVNQISK